MGSLHSLTINHKGMASRHQKSYDRVGAGTVFPLKEVSSDPLYPVCHDILFKTLCRQSWAYSLSRPNPLRKTRLAGQKVVMSDHCVESGDRVLKDAPISSDEAVLAALGRKDLLVVRERPLHNPVADAQRAIGK